VARPEVNVAQRAPSATRIDIQPSPPKQVEGLGRLAAALAPFEGAAPQLEARLRLLTIALRWVTVTVGALAGILRDPDGRMLSVAAALILFSALITVRQLVHWTPNSRQGALIILELVITVTAAAATGGLDSPFILTPLTGLLLTGYVFGRRASVGTAVAGVLAVIATIVLQSVGGDERAASQIAVVYLLCGALGAFTRNLVVEIEAQRAAAIDQAAQMATANELLMSLHALAQTLPASFDLGEVVASIRQRLRALLDFTVLVVLVRDDAGSGWRVELAEGVRMPMRLADEELPKPLRRAIASTSPVIVEDRLVESTEEGFAALARSGLYTALRTRGVLVGLVALEHVPPKTYGEDDAELLENLSSVLGLSIDNAKWFGRIRTIGAEAERARIARELHDRIAQSLAYVTFELERLQVAPGEKQDELGALHDVVRDIVRELRETIYQLRANVTEEVDLVTVAADYLVRFAERTGIRVVWTPASDARLPYRVEQELWRILQEAIANVERHAHAAEVVVSWEVRGTIARLVIADNGRGFDPGAVSGDHYGLVGMRERADAIGARLWVDSRPGKGTRVIVELELGRAGVEGQEQRTA
jgi:signal transduction histidine kinase